MSMAAESSDAPTGAGRWRGLMPPARWLGSYERQWFRPDLAAGVTLAAYLLPAALGDASLAGLPPQAGLYSCLFGGLVFWLFCSSRQTSITVTSAISLLIGSSLGSMAGGDPARFASLAACTALLTAAIVFLSWLARAGAAVSFISESVIYFNAEHIFDTVLARIETTEEPIRLVICDLSTSPNVDIAGARMLHNLHDELSRRGIDFRLVEAHSSVRDMLRVEGVEEKTGRIDRFTSLAAVIEDFHSRTRTRTRTNA